MSLFSIIGSAVLACVLAFGGGFWKGMGYEKGREARAVAVQAEKARTIERETARTTFRLQEARDAENLRTGDRLAAALGELRSRPARMPAAAAPACAGADGSGLSGPDAGFLVGEAARANRLRADLETCRGWIEKVTKGATP